jgi:hypothetical protein
MLKSLRSTLRTSPAIHPSLHPPAPSAMSSSRPCPFPLSSPLLTSGHVYMPLIGMSLNIVGAQLDQHSTLFTRGSNERRPRWRSQKSSDV